MRAQPTQTPLTASNARRGQGVLPTLGSLGLATCLTAGFMLTLRVVNTNQHRQPLSSADGANAIGFYDVESEVQEFRTQAEQSSKSPRVRFPEQTYHASPNATPKVQRADSPESQLIRTQYHVTPGPTERQDSPRPSQPTTKVPRNPKFE
ncbi:MAG: hypothetical protein JNL67_10210 [Planctomycetaceae bacterium]|nr:hypothetical protein [Planctomycetaceae bacterium]